jgi:hypothetical protein
MAIWLCGYGETYSSRQIRIRLGGRAMCVAAHRSFGSAWRVRGKRAAEGGLPGGGHGRGRRLHR